MIVMKRQGRRLLTVFETISVGIFQEEKWKEPEQDVVMGSLSYFLLQYLS